MQVAQLFGGERAERMRGYMRDFAASFGVEGMEQPDHLPNTRRALAVAELARENGRLDAFREAAMDAHWREGRDLESEAVIRDLAERAGLDPDEAAAAMEEPHFLERVDAIRREASEHGVTGIPTFFFDDRPVVGCQPYHVLAHAAEQAGAERRGEPR